MMLHFGDGFEMKRHERLLLRPWLENLIDSAKIPGLEWIDNTRSLFRVPWKHQSRKTWSLGHSSVFLEWAKNTGRWKEGDPEPHYAQLKTRLRCAFSKAPDIEEMKEMHCSKAEEPYKVYRFIPKKESRFYPFGRKAIARKSIHSSSLRRNNTLPGCHPSLGSNTLKKFDVKPLSFRNEIKGFDELPLVTCNDLATDDIAEPVQEDEILRQVEMVDDFHGHILDNDLIVNNLPTSTAYPVIHAVFDSLSIPQITTADFKATTEATEVHEYYCGKRQTILPPVDGSLSRPESKNSGMDQPDSMSVMVSQSPRCTEVLPEKESGSNLDLSDLPKMSIMEKVESWKMTGFTTGGDEAGHLKTPIVDDWITKVTERTTDISASTETVSKNNTDGVQSFREMVIGDSNCGIQSTYGTRDKKISLGKSGDISGSNVAVATPIFPLKNRYNVSRNHPDKETLMPQSPNDRSFFPHNNAISAPSYVMAQNGKRVPLENAKCGDQDMFRGGVTSLDWQSAVAEKRRKLDENTVAVQYHSFPEDPNKCGGNWQMSLDACSGNWQKQGEAYEETWRQSGDRQSENWQMQSKEEDVVWQASFPQPNRNWQQGRNENWQMPGERFNSKFELSCDATGQKVQTVNKYSERNVKSFAGQNDGNWDLFERSPNGNQQALLNGGDRGRKWSSEDTNEVEARWSILRENLTKDGPLDLSNKTDFYVHYSIDNHRGLCPPEICAKMADHTPDFISRTADGSGHNSCRMENSKGWGNVNEEQERHVKKLSHHALSMDSSLNHLKAAYKKLVLRTMYVTEKERELDNLEKRLHAREEAVRHKEQQLQKVLWALADRRLPAELGKQPSCTKVFPEVGRSDWNMDENQRKSYQEHSAIPRWNEKTESCIQSPNETLPIENMTSMKSYVVSGNQNQIHGRTDYGFDLGDGICGNTRIPESPVSMRNSNQPFYEPMPPHVLPSVDEHPCSQNEYMRRRYLEEPEDGQPSGVYLPAAGCSYRSNSAVASHTLSWSDEVKDSAEERGMASGRTGVSSGRPFPKDLKLGSISMNSCPVIAIEEPCAAKTFGGRCFERRTFESPDQNNILLLRNSSFSAMPVPQSSNEVTRILPPVSPDIGVMN